MAREKTVIKEADYRDSKRPTWVPDEFSLSKYVGAKNFTSEQWARLFAYRHDVFKHNRMACLPDILKNPLEAAFHADSSKYPFIPTYNATSDIKYYQLENMIETFGGLLAEAKKDWGKNEFRSVKDDLPMKIGLLLVELEMPRSVLMDSFSRYLKCAGVSDKKNAKSRLTKFFASGILPFTDLYLWKVFSGKRITDVKLTEALNLKSQEGTPAEHDADSVSGLLTARKQILKGDEKLFSPLQIDFS
jgi:hypothetical protein